MVRAESGPTLKFLYRSPEHPGLRLQATVTQCQSDLNPTPDVTSESLADDFVENTNTKLPGIDAGRLGMAGDYVLVWRRSADRSMLCGLQVRGNTTVVVSLIGSGPERDSVRGRLSEFSRYLRRLSLQQAGDIR